MSEGAHRLDCEPCMSSCCPKHPSSDHAFPMLKSTALGDVLELWPVMLARLLCRPAHLLMELPPAGDCGHREDRALQRHSLAALPGDGALGAAAGARWLQQCGLVHQQGRGCPPAGASAPGVRPGGQSGGLAPQTKVPCLSECANLKFAARVDLEVFLRPCYPFRQPSLLRAKA